MKGMESRLLGRGDLRRGEDGERGEGQGDVGRSGFWTAEKLKAEDDFSAECRQKLGSCRDEW